MNDRTCIVTRERAEPDDLIRFVVGPDSAVVPDLKRNLPGRGCWVTADRLHVDRAVSRKAFARALKSEVIVPPDLGEMVDRLLTRSALGALGLARKAGAVALGAAKVEAAVMKALQKDPADRFQTVREFSSVIEACRDELAIRLPPVPDRALDAPTLSRTAINPALQGVKQLPAAAPKTLPAWARLGAVALVLAGLGGAAVWLWPTTLPPAEPPSAGPVKPAPAPVPAAETVSAKPVDVAPATQAAPVAAAPVAPAPVALPPRSLAIVRLTAEGKADPAGAANTPAQFRPGERIRLLIAPSHEAYVYCYLQDQTRSIVRFYPNRFSAGSLVSPATPLEIPGRMGFELVADSLKAEETVACFASERDVTTELPASVYGMDFARLPAASLEEVSQAFARVSAGNLTEARFRIDVR